MRIALSTSMLVVVWVIFAWAEEPMPAPIRPPEYWIEQIKAKRGSVDEAKSALVQAGEKAVPGLLKLLKDDAHVNRLRAVEALGEIARSNKDLGSVR